MVGLGVKKSHLSTVCLTHGHILQDKKMTMDAAAVAKDPMVDKSHFCGAKIKKRPFTILPLYSKQLSNADPTCNHHIYYSDLLYRKLPPPPLKIYPSFMYEGQWCPLFSFSLLQINRIRA